MAATFGRGAMTNHWRDIKHADVILINGANPAEAHPVGFQWFVKAKLDPTKGPGSGGGAKIIHADPRYTRTSALSDMYLRIRTGTDVAYFGGLINYVIQNKLYHEDYVKNYTNASFIVKEGFDFKDGLFSGYNASTRSYDISTWGYETEGTTPLDGPPGATAPRAKRDMTLQDPRSVFQLMAKHYSRYTPEMVSSITGIPVDQFTQVAKIVGEMGKPDKVMTIVYAVGLTHHTTGGQLIRSGALLQLLLGNMGRPGGGMNAERGHANIQGNTDHAISWEILPGYLRIPAPGQKNLDQYVQLNAPKRSDPNSWNFFGINYRNFMVSLLKAWYGGKATKDNEYAYDFIPKPAVNSSWMSIYDQALKGKMEGVLLSGMTATSIGPDSNQVLQALANLKWLVVMDAFPTTSSEFWRAPGMDAAKINTEVFMLPATHWIEKDGSFVNSGRWSQWKEQVLPPEGDARHDHWITADLFDRVKTLYKQQGGKFPDPIMALTLDYKDPKKPELDEIAKEINGKDLKTGSQMTSFANLKDDGTTTAGDWIYTGSYPDAGNLMKRLRGSRRQAVGPEASRHPVERHDLDGGRAGLSGDDESQRSCRVAPVHHERRGRRAALLELDARWALPRALRAVRGADPEPAAPEPVGGPGRVPLRPGRGAAQPLRKGRQVPVCRDELSAHRARALHHAAGAAPGRPAAAGVRRSSGGAGQREGDQQRRPRPGLQRARQARGLGPRDQAPRTRDARGEQEGLPDRHSHPLGVHRRFR
ncbi:MAG: hypothetical protein E6H84_13680 [Chloroflexi bacterium]|nr:MAG: hypothetical protein E6H84_13680 [Chloroflexota bacterium]